MKQQRLRLENGLWVMLSRDPGATRAAALFHLSAGSHHEPEQWPGLAHLFEHVVFAGSQEYEGDSRLMSWAQAEDARLNATTLPTATAWFFDVAAAKLEAGFARLTDMLARPRLALDAIKQETTVIDAEFRMLATDADTLCEAALGAVFDSPKALSTFHVGNLSAFGEDLPALQAALRDYHRQHFHTGLLSLWISGPQPLDELAALAKRYAHVFPPVQTHSRPATAPLALSAQRSYALRSEGPARLHLSFMLALTRQAATSLTLLRQFFIDEAPLGLLDTLRMHGLCDSVQLMKPYNTESEAIITFEFLLNRDSHSTTADVETLFFHWLDALSALTDASLRHYASLAADGFSHLSPVDKLRTTAFDFPPVDKFTPDEREAWKRLLSQLTRSRMARLWATAELHAQPRKIQGFDLPITPFDMPAASHIAPPDFVFYPLGQPVNAPVLPEQKITLPHALPGEKEGVVIVSPVLGDPLPSRWAYILQASLRALIGQCAHQGTRLTFERYQGQWLLQLSGPNALLAGTLDAVIRQFTALSAEMLAQGERQFRQAEQALHSEIAIRCLLNRLPLLLSAEPNLQTPCATLPEVAWNAALYGGDKTLHDAVSRLLSRFPGKVNAASTSPLPPQSCRSRYLFPTASQDAAVLLFCPLVEQTPVCLAAWQLLASLFEPQFFQRLRVELNIGYVVSCRFMQSAGESGILFAVQSPSHCVEQIVGHIEAFIGDMSESITMMTQQNFAEKRDDLGQKIQTFPQERVECLRESWLRDNLYTSPLTPRSLSSLTLPLLQDFYLRLRLETSRWWWLCNTPESPQVQ